MPAPGERWGSGWPAAAWRDATARWRGLRGRRELRYAEWAVLPVLALLAGLSPQLFGTKVTFIIIVIVTYLLVSARTNLLGVALLAMVLVWIPREMNQFEQGIMFNVALYTLLGIGLNVVVGYAGLLDLGYVAFFATGAYAYALVAAPDRGGGWDLGVSFWIVLPMAVLLASLVGIVLGLPVLRLRGDYLAIVTLGFGEIIRIMINNEAQITNGPQGVYSIPDTSFFGSEVRTPVEYYYLLVAAALLAAVAAERIRASRVGRAWEAIREDEDVAASMGVDITMYKLLAFAIGAAIGAAGGTIFAARQGAIFPQDFDLTISINVLAIVIIGGMGSMRGVILGSFLLIALPDVLRDFSLNLGFTSFEDIGARYRLVIFGAALVVVMVLRPQGIVPSARRQADVEQREQLDAELAT